MSTSLFPFFGDTVTTETEEGFRCIVRLLGILRTISLLWKKGILK